jgi:tetratricopeptide (TPR) repeat protein
VARERYALELEAAAVLRDRERGLARLASPAKKAKGAPAASAPVATSAPVPTGFLATRPALRGFLWGTVTAASLAALVLVVWRQAKPREEGGSLTGEIPMAGRGAAPDAEMSQLTAAIAQHPDDLELRMELAQLHLRRRDLMGVWNETQHVLEKQPGHPRALAYQALVRLAMGQPDVATSMLEQAIKSDPDLVEGYLHLALVYVRTGREKDADALMKQASQRLPAQAPLFARAMAEIRAAGAEPPPEGDPHADVAAPGAQADAGTSAPPAGAPRVDVAADGPGLSGVIELPAALRARVGPGALVFLTVRDAGATEGPPVAVKRLPASFPLAFAVGPADSMMGQPLPARARVEARVDSDGDPLTRVPTDPSARLDGVAAGSTRLRLVLQ